MFEFAYPYLLFALLLIPGLVWYELRFRRHPSVVTPSVLPFRNLRRRRRLALADMLYLAAFALVVVAAARPRTGDELQTVRSKGIDIVLALDMSGSMRAIDLPQDVSSRDELAELLKRGVLKNRLTVAKGEIRRFIEARPNDKIGLIGFADLAYSFAPPTLDHNWLLERLETLEPGQLGDTTGIAAPIGAGIRRLRNSASPRRVLVLFTDGTNTAENKLTPQQAAKLAKEFNVILHTVGIGSGSAVVAAGSFYQPIRDNFDEPLLKALAEETGGRYFRAADAAGMKAVMAEINALEKTNIEQPRRIEYREYAPQLALIAALLLLAGIMTSSLWKVRIP